MLASACVVSHRLRYYPKQAVTPAVPADTVKHRLQSKCDTRPMAHDGNQVLRTDDAVTAASTDTECLRRSLTRLYTDHDHANLSKYDPLRGLHANKTVPMSARPTTAQQPNRPTTHPHHRISHPRNKANHTIYNDGGTGFSTEKPFVEYAVSAATGEFVGAKIITIFF